MIFVNKYKMCQVILTKPLEGVVLLVNYLYSQTDIEIISASTMVDNHASARVPKKNGFTLVVSSAGEDWGYESLTKANKWVR